jgi:hypothetical protein
VPVDFWNWLFQQAPVIVVLILTNLGTVWAIAVRGHLVPGYVYRRELERADMLQELLVRSIQATHRAATAAEKATSVRSRTPK